MLIRPRALAVVAVLVAMAATGCAGSSSKASTLPPLSPTPTSASPSPPATGPTKAVLEQTVRRYYSEIEAAAASGNTQRLVAMTTTSCPCRRLVGFIQNAYKNGGRIRGWRYEIESVGTPSVSGREANVLVVYSLPRIEAFDAAGQVTQAEAAIAHQTASVSAVWSGTDWRISYVAFLGVKK